MAYAITQAQYERILARLTALETHANDLAVAQDQLVSLAQINELLTITSANIQALSEQVTALETRVVGLEEEPLE